MTDELLRPPDAKVRRETWERAIKLARDHVNKYSSYRCAEHIIEELETARESEKHDGE